MTYDPMRGQQPNADPWSDANSFVGDRVPSPLGLSANGGPYSFANIFSGATKAPPVVAPQTPARSQVGMFNIGVPTAPPVSQPGMPIAPPTVDPQQQYQLPQLQGETGPVASILGGLLSIPGQVGLPEFLSEHLINFGRLVGGIADWPFQQVKPLSFLPGGQDVAQAFAQMPETSDKARYEAAIMQDPVNQAHYMAQYIRQFQQDYASTTGRNRALASIDTPSESLGGQVAGLLGILGAMGEAVHRTFVGSIRDVQGSIINNPDPESLAPQLQYLRNQYLGGKIDWQQLLDDISVSPYHWSNQQGLGGTAMSFFLDLFTDPLVIGSMGLGLAAKTVETGAVAERGLAASRLLRERDPAGWSNAVRTAQSTDGARIAETMKATHPDLLREVDQMPEWASVPVTRTKRALITLQPILKPAAHIANELQNPLGWLGLDRVGEAVGSHIVGKGMDGTINAMGAPWLVKLSKATGMDQARMAEALGTFHANMVNKLHQSNMVREIQRSRIRFFDPEGGAPNLYAQARSGVRTISSEMEDIVRFHGRDTLPRTRVGKAAIEDALNVERTRAAQALQDLGVTPEAALNLTKKASHRELAAIHELNYGRAATDFAKSKDELIRQTEQRWSATPPVDQAEADGRTAAMAIFKRMTMISDHELTDVAAKQVLQMVMDKDMVGLHSAIERYYALNWLLGGARLPDDILLVEAEHMLRSLLDTSDGKKRLVHLLDPHQLAEPMKTWAEQELAKYGEQAYNVGLAPEDQWAYIHGPNGDVIGAHPWMDVVGGGKNSYLPTTADRLRLGMFTPIRGNRLMMEAHRSFMQSGIEQGLTHAQANQLFTKLRESATDQMVGPRGLSVEDMWDTAIKIKGIPNDVLSKIGDRGLAKMFVQAWEGELRSTGLTTKLSGMLKTTTAARGNYIGRVAEKFYPLARFYLSPFFLMQEWLEGPFFNILRGNPPGWTWTERDIKIRSLIERVNTHSRFTDNFEYLFFHRVLEGETSRVAGPTSRLARAGKKLDGMNIHQQKYLNYMRQWSRDAADQMHDSFESMQPGEWHLMEQEFNTINRVDIMLNYLTQRGMGRETSPRLGVTTMDRMKPPDFGRGYLVLNGDIAREHNFPNVADMRRAVRLGMYSFDSFRTVEERIGAHPDWISHAYAILQRPSAEEFSKVWVSEGTRGGMADGLSRVEAEARAKQYVSASMAYNKAHAETLGIPLDEYMANIYVKPPAYTTHEHLVPSDALHQSTNDSVHRMGGKMPTKRRTDTIQHRANDLSFDQNTMGGAMRPPKQTQDVPPLAMTGEDVQRINQLRDQYDQGTITGEEHDREIQQIKNSYVYHDGEWDKLQPGDMFGPVDKLTPIMDHPDFPANLAGPLTRGFNPNDLSLTDVAAIHDIVEQHKIGYLDNKRAQWELRKITDKYRSPEERAFELLTEAEQDTGVYNALRQFRNEADNLPPRHVLDALEKAIRQAVEEDRAARALKPDLVNPDTLSEADNAAIKDAKDRFNAGEITNKQAKFLIDQIRGKYVSETSRFNSLMNRLHEEPELDEAFAQFTEWANRKPPPGPPPPPGGPPPTPPFPGDGESRTGIPAADEVVDWQDRRWASNGLNAPIDPRLPFNGLLPNRIIDDQGNVVSYNTGSGSTDHLSETLDNMESVVGKSAIDETTQYRNATAQMIISAVDLMDDTTVNLWLRHMLRQDPEEFTNLYTFPFAENAQVTQSLNAARDELASRLITAVGLSRGDGNILAGYDYAMHVLDEVTRGERMGIDPLSTQGREQIDRLLREVQYGEINIMDQATNDYLDTITGSPYRQSMKDSWAMRMNVEPASITSHVFHSMGFMDQQFVSDLGAHFGGDLTESRTKRSMATISEAERLDLEKEAVSDGIKLVDGMTEEGYHALPATFEPTDFQYEWVMARLQEERDYANQSHWHGAGEEVAQLDPVTGEALLDKKGNVKTKKKPRWTTADMAMMHELHAQKMIGLDPLSPPEIFANQDRWSMSSEALPAPHSLYDEQLGNVLPKFEALPGQTVPGNRGARPLKRSPQAHYAVQREMMNVMAERIAAETGVSVVGHFVTTGIRDRGGAMPALMSNFIVRGPDAAIDDALNFTGYGMQQDSMIATSHWADRTQEPSVAVPGLGHYWAYDFKPEVPLGKNKREVMEALSRYLTHKDGYHTDRFVLAMDSDGEPLIRAIWTNDVKHHTTPGAPADFDSLLANRRIKNALYKELDDGSWAYNSGLLPAPAGKAAPYGIIPGPGEVDLAPYNIPITITPRVVKVKLAKNESYATAGGKTIWDAQHPVPAAMEAEMKGLRERLEAMRTGATDPHGEGQRMDQVASQLRQAKPGSSQYRAGSLWFMVESMAEDQMLNRHSTLAAIQHGPPHSIVILKDSPKRGYPLDGVVLIRNEAGNDFLGGMEVKFRRDGTIEHVSATSLKRDTTGNIPQNKGLGTLFYDIVAENHPELGLWNAIGASGNFSDVGGIYAYNWLQHRLEVLQKKHGEFSPWEWQNEEAARIAAGNMERLPAARRETLGKPYLDRLRENGRADVAQRLVNLHGPDLEAVLGDSIRRHTPALFAANRAVGQSVLRWTRGHALKRRVSPVNLDTGAADYSHTGRALYQRGPSGIRGATAWNHRREATQYILKNYDATTALHETFHTFVADLDDSAKRLIREEYLKANPTVDEATTPAWDDQMEEWAADQWELHVRDPSTQQNPQLTAVTNMFTKMAADKGWDAVLPGDVNPVLAKIFQQATGRDHTPAVTFNADEQRLWETARINLLKSEEQAHTTHYYARGRSWMQRSLNHPYLGLYPLSYMWGKVVPEMLRFLVKSPFGLKAPLGGLLMAKDVMTSLQLQMQTDPNFSQWVSDHPQTIQFLSLMLPGTPWETPVNLPVVWRRGIQNYIANEQRVAQGHPEQQKPFDFLSALQDMSQYSVGVFRFLGQADQILGEFNPSAPTPTAVAPPNPMAGLPTFATPTTPTP